MAHAAARGASGTGRCRVVDVSLGGCFIATLATPVQGEQTEIGIPFGDDLLRLSGIVVSIERGIGFSVRFDGNAPEVMASLAALIHDLEQTA